MEIKLKNVTYKKNIKKLNLTFKENEITSIIGKNSCGKTDILDLIYCTDLLEDGEIKIGDLIIDKNIKLKKVLQIRRNISYLVDDYKKQLFNINIFEDIKYAIGNINKELLENLLKLFDLNEDILSKNYLEISRGEKKKICLIITFLKDSKVILLDNPTSGLDYKSTQNLIKFLKKEKRNGKIIILTSYNSDFVLQVSDRVIVIDDKKFILDEDKYKAMSNKDLLNRVHFETPNIINFENRVLELKKIKLGYRDNINDLIKDIYRNVK